MKRLLTIILLLIIARTLYAYDFSAVCSTGQTLYYNITSDSTVVVTYPGNYGVSLLRVWNGTNWPSTTTSQYCDYIRDPRASNGYYRVSNTYTRPTGKLRLPHLVQYNGITYTITGISDYAFYQCFGLTLIIPNGMTIGNGSLNGVTHYLQSDLYYHDSLYYEDSTMTKVIDYDDSIRHIVFPNSVTSIVPGLFLLDTLLESISFGCNLSVIPSNAFYGCSSVRTISLPDNIDTIEDGAFGNCIGIENMYIGTGLKYIAITAFSGCTNIRTLFFNAKRVVGSFDFPKDSLSTIIFGDSVKHIPAYLCEGATSLSSVCIPNGVHSIGDNAFYGCSSLLSVAINDSIDSIGNWAFYGCVSLDSIYIGENVKYIGDYAFRGIDSIQVLYYNAKLCSNPNSYPSSGSGRENSMDVGEGVYYPTYYRTGLGVDFYLDKLIIGDSVQRIPKTSFYNCTIRYLYLGSDIIEIPSLTLYRCSIQNLNYNISNCHSLRDSNNRSVHYSTVRYEAPFMYSTIDSLAIGLCVQAIPSRAFENSSLRGSIVIPENVSSIGSRAFAGCSNVDSIIISEGVVNISDRAFQGCSNIIDINIPNSVTTIGGYSFYGCNNVRRISLGVNIDTIGGAAFKDCSHVQHVFYNIRSLKRGLFSPAYTYQSPNYPYPQITILSIFDELCQPDSITIGDSVKDIPSYCFKGRNGIHALINDVDSLGMGSFMGCINLLTVYANSHNIGNSAFANCDRLVSVTLGDSVQTLGSGAFSGCFRLNNVSLGEGITSIGDSAFGGCIRLIKPNLPSNLANIGTRAFDGCGDINGKLTFPASITHIGDSAYNGVGNITEIEMKGSTPPTIHSHTFAAVDSLVTVSVPCGAVLNYYITDYWENFPNIVEAPPYRLTVQSNNEVMGSATVTQQTTCSNHTATIYAVAQTGYHFLQWNDGITANPRTVPMTQDSTFTAIFVVNNSYITVHANDSTMGSVSGTGLYGYNAPVTLTATAYSGYHFLRWSDGNTQNPRYLAAVRDSSFTAIFVSNVSTITVANANPDMGNVSGSGVYYYQNLVSLTATANYGYHFVQWNDGNTQNPRTILVSQDSAFTAFFALNTYSIVATSNSTTMGSVSGGGQYTYLHEMSMTATPAYGYHFVQWNDGVTDNPRTITVTRDSAFTAQFAANSYTLTVAPNDATMGSAYGAGSYNYNTTATLTAVPNYGYHFTQWSDAVTDNPRTVTVLNNATYTAQFEINSYIITVQSSNPAIGTTSGSGSYNYLTPVNITALPNAGYHFTQWSDGNTTNPRLISVTANATYTAQFAINSYAVGATSNNSTMGSVSGSGTYNHNSTATLTATPYYGYHFVQWQDGNTQNPRTVTVTDSAQYTAQFDYNSYLVTALSSNVTLGTATGGGSYNYLSQVALTAVPAPHYHFTMWNDSIEDNPRTITVTRDTTLTAHFSIDRHTIGVNTANATQGTATGSDTVDYNTPVWITAMPNYGYHFTQWQDGNNSNPRRVVVSQDTVFTASFAPNQYTATCMANDNSRGSVASAGGSYNYLTSVTFTAVPNANYHFQRWSNGSTDNPITFTLTQDTALTAIFVGLTANVDDNTTGTATHTKTANLVEVVTATPNYGYHFVQWQDGNTDNPRTVTLTQDTVLTAYFAVNSYHVTLGSNDSTLGSVQGSGDYDYLSQVTISATAAQHCHFVQWSDGNTTNPRLLTLTCDTVFTALFERDQQYQIVVTANDSTRGSVAGGGQYYLGEAVAIAATANEHYYFEQWSDGVTSNPRVVTVTGDATYTAVFEPVMYTLTVAANDYAMGQVAGSGSYAYGSTVTIEARAFGGYRFVGWDDGVQDGQRTVTVTADATYTALFEANVGIEDAEGETYKVYAEHGHIVVEGVEAKRVQIYDLTGRRHATAEQLPTGVYVVRIDNRITKRVVVM